VSATLRLVWWPSGFQKIDYLSAMGSLNFNEFVPYFLLLLGIAAIVFPFFVKPRLKRLSETGVRCDGIIFKLGYQNKNDAIRDAPIKDKITVRFVTETKEWITADLKTDFMLLSTGQFMEGQKVVVIYDPNNPADFTLEKLDSETPGRVFFIIAGGISLAAGIYQIVRGK
jgi:hypothetical protein